MMLAATGCHKECVAAPQAPLSLKFGKDACMLHWNIVGMNPASGMYPASFLSYRGQRRACSIHHY
jgi:hypothetical protein